MVNKDSTIVRTKAEMKEAIKKKYGIIHIRGDLFDEIFADLNKKKDKHTAGWVGAIVTFIAICTIPVSAPLSILSLPIIGTIFSASSILGNLKASHYEPREDFVSEDDLDGEEEIAVVHKDIIKDIRSKYKGVEEATANNGAELTDMTKMSVNKIHITPSLYAALLDAKEEVENARRQKAEEKGKKVEYNDEWKKLNFIGYKEVDDKNGSVALVRIR